MIVLVNLYNAAQPCRVAHLVQSTTGPVLEHWYTSTLWGGGEANSQR